MQVGGPFADMEGLEKSSSDGLVKEVLIWQHRALILLSPSSGNPMSISVRSEKKIRDVGKESNMLLMLLNCITDPLSIKKQQNWSRCILSYGPVLT